ncbi:TIGR02680 family protein [Nocardia uniformis]|uniref:TIGR02680 family protein n=1 Tax=Nocardia uniformis TaxID=53432 RepID=A0A849C4U2_9NOCA|nr:TIGR02680 family protein [Nocardia uniformis]NNH72798.1 TIGR02680 family protein [Nocardia uniformis]
MTETMDQPDTGVGQFGPEWLRAALDGGLPTPGRSRWQPLRVGIANLWEYDDAEFWFADGRLVLRGGNGAGKTKVLELTTLLLLRGEIAPSVLDPFGSQHRTMRFNLLPTGDGDDPRAPADAGLGYAWVEFGRMTLDGSAEYFTCGLGASARAGTGSANVTTWHFVTKRRLGQDFRLLDAGRAVEHKDLKKIEGVVVPTSAAAYRARLADELFGLSPESYDNLTELLKQLRKPKLGERLNPASLAMTLRDALPPLATHEVDQLADGWEHLEQLRLAMQRTEDAARAIAQFVRLGWQPWARVVMRRRSDEMASATTSLDKTTAAKKAAEQQLADAGELLARSETELGTTKRDYSDSNTALRELLESHSYQDAVAAAGRIDSLGQALSGVKAQVIHAAKHVDRERASESKAATTVAQAQANSERAGGAVRTTAEAITEASEPAGLAIAVARYLPDRDVDALAGELQSRTERFEHLRTLDATYSKEAKAAERSGQKVELAAESVDTARAGQDQALATVQVAAQLLEDQVRGWAANAEMSTGDISLVGSWCDLIAGMTEIDDTGSVPEHASVVDAMRAHVTQRREGWTRQAESLRLQRQPLSARLAEIAERLATVRAETDGAPPSPTLWRRRTRPELSERAGAPLWRLVNPMAGVDDAALATVEAALAGSGLLDAWVSPDGSVDFGVADLAVSHSRGDERGAHTLLAILEPVEAGGVSVETAARILGQFGWREGGFADDLDDRDWLAADGSWRVGGLAGRAEAAGPAAYLGTAAREAARVRLIATLEAEQVEVESHVADIDRQLGIARAALSRLVTEEKALPTTGERELAAAVVRWADRGRALLARTAELDVAERAHGADLTRRDEARAHFAEYASTHRFALTDLDAQQRALTDFRTYLERFGSALDKLVMAEEALDTAVGVHQDREKARQQAEVDLVDLETDQRRVQVQLDTARSALGEDQQQQIARKETIEKRIETLESELDRLTDQRGNARTACAVAEQTLNNHEASRADAERQRDAAMTALWEAVDSGLTHPLSLDPPQRQNVQSARELATAIRREVNVKAEQADAERAWRLCLQKLEELRQSLLPQQDARVLDDEDTLPRVEIHTDATLGFQLPPAAADTLAERVSQQRDGYDEEQQRVLATLLGSTFIEHLKERLDYTTRTFANINNHLAAHPTRQGHAVKVEWGADPADPDAASVVGALGKGYHELSSDRQEMVRQFLARKIDQARAEATAEGAADWKQQLTRALDYRGWLKITLQYRAGATSKFTLFDAAKHGAKSGGEKVVLLSQPLFAAAVVAYDAAAAHAPRWVWLDEAMTGVDAQVKASFMGLTVDFELDIMLTAHDEWCNYDTVPAVAVYDLARERHLPGVDVLPYLWCGGRLTSIDVDRLGVVESRAELSEGLFGFSDG